MLDYSLPVAKRTRRGQELLSKSTKVMCQVATTTSSDSTKSRDKSDTFLSLDDDDDDEDDDDDYDGDKEEVEMEGSQSDSEEEFFDIVEEGSNGKEVKNKVKSKRDEDEDEDEGLVLIGKDVEERSSAKSKNDKKMKKKIVETKLVEENDGFEIVQESEGVKSERVESENEDEDEDEDEDNGLERSSAKIESDGEEYIDLTKEDVRKQGSNSRKRTDYIYDSREDNSLFDDFVNPDLGFQPEPFNSFNYEEGTAWDLIPAGTMQSMYHHQREGFKFLWNNVAGAFHLEKLKNPETKNCGSGCIISHVPGTGKSRLTLVFLQSYMRRFPNCMPVIVAPRSMLLTWEEEFKKWKVDIPFHILNIPDLSGYDSVYRATKDPRVVRLIKLLSWKKHKSVLGISYKLFERLTGDDNKKGHKDFYEYEKIKTLLLDTPDLFIFDEGHTPRNERSQMFQALFQIKTEKRIILSGTPFQNNFKELYNTLRLVRPSFTDKMLAKNGEVQKKRGPKSSESKQKWISLTDNIIHSGSQLQNPSIEELRATISPFVHIHKGNILKQSLQGLRHAVLILQPGNIQKNLLDIVEGPKYALKDDCAVSLLSVHPSLLHDSINKQALVGKYKLQDLRLKPEAGVKTWFLMELLQLSEALKEKVLVFGQYIEALTCIKDQLEFHRKWTEGREILYMDGKSEARKRQSYINLFNDPKSDARIMLASIKSCGEGINLIGASRVVLLDVLWNPSAERQAISRAYRIGQKKVVYVYRLITSGTMEEGKWSRQAEKDRLSKLVFSSSSEMCGENHEQEMSRLWEDTILDEMVNHEKLEKMFKDIIYQKQPNESDFLESTE
ncbi:hypothetical protein ACFE04_027470 [Oxalis oulophora]